MEGELEKKNLIKCRNYANIFYCAARASDVLHNNCKQLQNSYMKRCVFRFELKIFKDGDFPDF